MEIPDYSRKSSKIGSKRHKRYEAGRRLTFGYCYTHDSTLEKFMGSQTGSLASSFDDHDGHESGSTHHHHHHHHHQSKTMRSMLGQSLFKKFRHAKSKEIDCDDGDSSLRSDHMTPEKKLVNEIGMPKSSSEIPLLSMQLPREPKPVDKSVKSKLGHLTHQMHQHHHPHNSPYHHQHDS